jgi:hypothetical protein
VATIVSGEVVLRDGVATGALPGRILRGATAEPHANDPHANDPRAGDPRAGDPQEARA